MNEAYKFSVLLLTVLLMLFNSSTSQWISQTSGTTNDLYAVSFTDVNTGTAVGALGTILRTTDGGVTWSPQTSNTTNTLFGVFFLNDSIGTAVGNNGTIRRTTDGGATWGIQSSGVPTNPLFAVLFTSVDTGTAVGGGMFGGPGSTIRRTTDGGTTWTAQTSGTTNPLRGVDFVNSDTGFVVGNSGTILWTSNGGNAWLPQSSNTTQHLFGVSFVDSRIGTAVGAGGTILRTTDGGATWLGQNSGTTAALNAVSFVDENSGVAVGDSGVILRTTNGGTNWMRESIGTVNRLQGVALIDAVTGTAVGFGGTILRRTTALAGTKSIGGVASDYPTVKAAIQDLNAHGVVPPGVTFLIRSGTYMEDSLRIRTATSSASAPITFKPDIGATVIINVTPPSTTYDFAIKIDTTQYVTVDGSNNGTTSRDLTINALGANGRRGVWVSGASHYATIKNCNINAGQEMASVSSAVIGIDFRFTGAGQRPDFVLADNNLIRYAYTGIRLQGTAAEDACESPVIRNNVIDSVAVEGINLLTFNGALIYNNDVNTLRGGTGTMHGIILGTNAARARVYNNKVHDLRMLSTTAATRGIFFNTSTSSTAGHAIFNNFVWAMTSPATGTGPLYGIVTGNGNATVPDTIAFNTVFMSGTSSGNRETAAFYQSSSIGAMYVRNNIFHNTRTDGTTGISLAMRKVTTSAVLISDNNNLYVGEPDAQHQTGRIQTTYYATLADWQAGNGSDWSSIAINSPFVSPTDLHIQTTAPTPLDSGGVPILGITTDIDDDPRDGTYPDIGADEFTAGPSTVTINVAVAQNWNILSLPVSNPVGGDSVLQVYTNSAFPYGFAFSGGYVQQYVMQNGPGYWIKNTTAYNQDITGTPLASLTIPVTSGWNMIGSQTTATDTGCVVWGGGAFRTSSYFAYSGGYIVTDSLAPGAGFWVKSGAAGTITLQDCPLSKQPAAASGRSIEELNTITIGDAAGGSQTLYFGADATGEIPVDMYVMPPLPPEGAFDTRFESADGGRMVQTHGVEVSEAIELPIVVRTSAHPLMVTWKVSSGGASYELRAGEGVVQTLSGEGTLWIADERVNRLTLRVVAGGSALPKEYALYQNYPNPFNPSTMIRYALPKASFVTLRVYNVLGQEVARLVNGDQKAGYVTVVWNGRKALGHAVSSGVYFYRIEAKPADGGKLFTQVKKMLILK